MTAASSSWSPRLDGCRSRGARGFRSGSWRDGRRLCSRASAAIAQVEIHGDDELWDWPLDDTLRQIATKQHQYAMVRFIFDDGRLTWSPTLLPNHVDQHVGWGTVTLTVPEFEVSRGIALLRQTAAPEVGRSALTLAASVASVVGGRDREAA